MRDLITPHLLKRRTDGLTLGPTSLGDSAGGDADEMVLVREGELMPAHERFVSIPADGLLSWRCVVAGSEAERGRRASDLSGANRRAAEPTRDVRLQASL
jgi:hypothetical protein